MAEYTATSGSYTTTLTVTEGAYDVASNTSPVTFTLTLKKNSGTGLWNSDSCPWSININGTSYSGTFTYNFRNYSSLTLKSSTTQTITHNGDGTKKIAVSASVNMNNTPYVYTMSPSGELTLATIPRASTVSASVSSITLTSTEGNAFAYSVTSQSSNFYSLVRYDVNGVPSVDYPKGNFSGTRTYYFTNNELLTKMPTVTSGTLEIAVYTYSDSSYTQLIGRKDTHVSISIDTSQIKPTISLGSISLASSPISGYAVAGYSSLKVHFATTNSSGASSVTTRFTTNNGSLQTSSTSATSAWIYTNTLPASDKFYTTTIWSASTDSRGANSDTVNQSFGVWGYKPPIATLRAYRVADSSSTTEDGAGQYVYVTFSGSVNGLRDANGNIIQNNPVSIQTMTCTYSGDISGTATNGQHIALADTQAVTFTLTVNDGIASSTATANIAQASYPLDLYDNGSGSVGVGLGTNAIAGYVMTPLRFQVNNTNSANGGVEIREDGEGGKITIYSPSGKTFEFDAYDNNTLRVWTSDDSNAYKAATFNRLTGVLSATGGFSGNLSGNATSATSANKVYFNRTTDSPNNALQQNAMVVGEYYDNSALPTSSGFYHVITLQGPDTNYGTQIAIGMTVRGVYYRRYVGGSWTSWEGLL